MGICGVEPLSDRGSIVVLSLDNSQLPLPSARLQSGFSQMPTENKLKLLCMTWRSGESNPFQWRKLHPLRHCSAAVAFPPFCPANPWRGQLKKMILVSPTCILLSQAIAGRDRCRQICKSQNDYHCPRGGIRTPINSNKSV